MQRLQWTFEMHTQHMYPLVRYQLGQTCNPLSDIGELLIQPQVLWLWWSIGSWRSTIRYDSSPFFMFHDKRVIFRDRVLRRSYHSEVGRSRASITITLSSAFGSGNEESHIFPTSAKQFDSLRKVVWNLEGKFCRWPCPNFRAKAPNQAPRPWKDPQIAYLGWVLQTQPLTSWSLGVDRLC